MDYSKKIIIAIDGPSSSGKSTLAKKISEKLNYQYINTGSIYRTITCLAIRKKMFNSDLWNIRNFIPLLRRVKIKPVWNKKINDFDIFLNQENINCDIRSLNVTKKVPLISRIPEIRKEFLNIQKNIIKKIQSNEGIVIEGRDIGNYIFPNSDFKFFVNSSLEKRSYRRYQEFIKNKISNISYEEIKNDILFRDQMDICREINPLKKSKDHIEIDNTFSIEKQLNSIFRIINHKNL